MLGSKVVSEEIVGALQQLVINTIAIHVFFRIVAFFKRPTLFDESPYLMRLHQPSQRPGEHDTLADPSKEVRQPSTKTRGRSKSPKHRSSGSKPIIIVTGSSGRIGSSVVQAALEDGSFHVRGVDRVEPSQIRRFEQAEYLMIDLVSSTDDQILEALQGAVAIVHCSGSVKLYPATADVHNDITFATVRLMWLAKQVGVTAFVHSSSTIVINNGILNVNAIPADSPYEECQTSAWGRAHVKTEKAVLSASDDPSKADGSFFTCSNRFPGIYGLNDRLVVSIMIESGLSIFPNRTDVRVEMLYLKNAAHAHLCALKALLDPSTRMAAAGQAQIITQSIEGETGTNLEFWTRARHILGMKRSFVILPASLFYIMACLLEFAYGYFAGFVPQSILWNFTRSFCRSMLHDNTYLGQREAFHALGYKPLFSNQSSFEDMAHELREQLSRSKMKLVMHLERDPKDDISWEPRDMPKNPSLLRSIFLSVLGPGISWHEICIFWLVHMVSATFAIYTARKYEYSLPQTAGILVLAMWSITGTVLSIGPSNKRWFYLGGQLGIFFFMMMVMDLLITTALAALLFPPHGEPVALVWFVLACGSVLFGLFVIIFLVPLAQQRSYSVICFLLVCSLQYLHVLPSLREGMEWLLPVVAMKFLVSNGPRHEPYV